MFLHVTEARYLDAYRIEVAFNNGKKGIADLADALKGPVFEPLKNTQAFARFLRSMQVRNHCLGKWC